MPVKRSEERIGVRLLARTTRSVAPTDAGTQLIASLRPALGDIRGALEQISELRNQPAGRVRVVASRLAAAMVLGPQLGRFSRDYPDVVLEVTTTHENRVDLVAAGCDAGVQAECVSNQLFIRKRPVHFGGVEERDTDVDSRADDRDAFFPAGGGPVAKADADAAEAQR